MKYHLRASEVAADIVCTSSMRAEQTRPIEAQSTSDRGPSPEDILRASEANKPVLLAGRYRLLRRLGAGGMGTVYLAEQLEHPQTRVAVKILDASAHDWCHAIDRFLWEARLCTRIRHPNIVAAHDYGSTPNGVVYMVMDLLEGQDLRALIRARGRLNWPWTRYVMRQVCAGVNALHRVGVVHRDLKPSNCFYVHSNGLVKILDLGIATFEDPLATPPGSDDRTVIGTAEYMPPEQIRGTPVDRRGDVYAAGIMIYELLTGRVPFRGHTTEQVFDRQLREPAPPIAQLASNLAVPDGLDAVLCKALAKRPRDRHANMIELADALDQLDDPAR